MVLERTQHGKVAVLTLNRPEAANSLNPELMKAITSTLREIEADLATQVVILTGSGEKIFCAGMDLKGFAESGSSTGGSDDGPDAYKMTTGFTKPIIAAVNGAAVGGGFELALSCDMIVAADTARFGLPEVKRGLFAAGGGTMLGTLIPMPLAMEAALTGDLYPADKVAGWGLVNRVVPFDRLLPEALELAEKIAANAPLGLAITKTLIRRSVEQDPALGRATPEESAKVFGSEDAKEGATAFIEKREPNWQGR
jgi:enoyl-CoA hydratase